MQIGEDADRTPGGLGGLADEVEALEMHVMRAVAHVEPGHVHAGLDQLHDLLEGIGRRAERSYDLGAAIGKSITLAVYHGQDSSAHHQPPTAYPSATVRNAMVKSVG